MKTGVIIYITGDMPSNWNEKLSDALALLNIKADAIEIVISKLEYNDIHYAWWRLITRGIHSISCKLAVFNSSMELMLTGKELRLCG